MTEGPHDNNGDPYHRRPSDNGTRMKKYVAEKVDHTYTKATTQIIIWVVGTLVIPFGLWWIQDELKTNRAAAIKMVESVQDIATQVKVTVAEQQNLKLDVLEHNEDDDNLHRAQWDQINNNRENISDLRDRTGRIEGTISGSD